MKSSVDNLKDELQSVKVEVHRLGQDVDDHNSRQFQELKSEIASVKGLLLNRYVITLNKLCFRNKIFLEKLFLLLKLQLFLLQYQLGKWPV